MIETKDTKENPVSVGDGICCDCESTPLDHHYGVCDSCYAEGWRAGEDMMKALRGDPVLDVDDEGKVGLKKHNVGKPYTPEALENS